MERMNENSFFLLFNPNSNITIKKIILASAPPRVAHTYKSQEEHKYTYIL